MPCPTCGAPTSEQATQCPSCGAQLTAESAPGGGAPWAPPPEPPGAGFSPYPTWEGANEPVSPASSVGQLASWWRRVGATIIDGLILGVISGVVGIATNRPVEYIVEFLLGLIYTTVLFVTRGQTVGMMAVGTRCMRENSGENLTPAAAIGRYLLTELLAITVIGFFVDVLWPLWDSKNQTVHDKAVHSLVVRTR